MDRHGSQVRSGQHLSRSRGNLVVDRPNQLHYDGAKDAECVLEIVGMGPMTTTQAGAK